MSQRSYILTDSNGARVGTVRRTYGSVSISAGDGATVEVRERGGMRIAAGAVAVGPGAAASAGAAVTFGGAASAFGGAASAFGGGASAFGAAAAAFSGAASAFGAAAIVMPTGPTREAAPPPRAPTPAPGRGVTMRVPGGLASMRRVDSFDSDYASDAAEYASDGYDTDGLPKHVRRSRSRSRSRSPSAPRPSLVDGLETQIGRYSGDRGQFPADHLARYAHAHRRLRRGEPLRRPRL